VKPPLPEAAAIELGDQGHEWEAKVAVGCDGEGSKGGVFYRRVALIFGPFVCISPSSSCALMCQSHATVGSHTWVNDGNFLYCGAISKDEQDVAAGLCPIRLWRAPIDGKSGTGLCWRDACRWSGQVRGSGRCRRCTASTSKSWCSARGGLWAEHAWACSVSAATRGVIAEAPGFWWYAREVGDSQAAE
jgi:hypothetical protein